MRTASGVTLSPRALVHRVRMETDPARPFVHVEPIPDGAPEDPPLTAEEAGELQPANRIVYEDELRAEREKDEIASDDEADPEPRG